MQECHITHCMERLITDNWRGGSDCTWVCCTVSANPKVGRCVSVWTWSGWVYSQHPVTWKWRWTIQYTRSSLNAAIAYNNIASYPGCSGGGGRRNCRITGPHMHTVHVFQGETGTLSTSPISSQALYSAPIIFLIDGLLLHLDSPS